MEKIININSKRGNVNINKIIEKSNAEKSLEKTYVSNISIAKDYCEIGYGNIYQKQYRYYKNTPKAIRPISNFIIELEALIQNEDRQSLQCNVVTDKCEQIEVDFDLKDFLSVNNFRKTLYSKNMTLIFNGKNEDLDNIKGILFRGEYDKISGKKNTGIYKHNNGYIYVGDDESIDSDGNVVNNIIYTGNAYLSSDITTSFPISPNELKEISKYLFNFNELGITASILGFCSSCFLRERLYLDNNTKGPNLAISGEAGSGKSETLENVIMPLFNTNSKMSAEQCTKFVNVKYAGSSNTIPFIIEEYKPTRMSKTRKDEISALMRNAYDRTPGYRGNTEQKLNEYPVITPVILLGEMSIEESAGLERSIMACFSKYKSQTNGREESFKYLKKNKQLTKKLGRALLREALNIDSEVLLKRYTDFETKYSYLPGRVKNNVVNCMLGILLIEDVYDRKGLNFQDSIGYKTEDVFEAIISNTVETVLEGNTGVKGIIEKDIEILNDMVETGELVKGIDYQMINSKTELAINVKMFYPKLLKYINCHNLKEIDKLSQIDFTKQLKLKEYYKDYKAIRFVHNSEAKNSKAFVLDVAKLTSKVNVDNFYL